MEEFCTIVIEGDKIYKSIYNNKTFIGYTLDSYNKLESYLQEALEKAERYYNLCVEHNLITPKLSQEEINAKLTSSLTEIVKELNTIKTQIAGLQGNLNEPTSSNPKSKSQSKNTTNN